jgi:hypothetical protein
METATNVSSTSARRAVLPTFVLARLASAPVSWLLDGITPSFIVYPLVLLLGLWRLRRGGGTLFFAIAGTVFLLIHLPSTWAAITDSGENPFNASAPYEPQEWLASLLLIPALMAGSGLLALREPKSDVGRRDRRWLA